MPLTAKGKKIRKAMRDTYGKQTGDRVFYASQAKGIISGAHQPSQPRPRKADRGR